MNSAHDFYQAGGWMMHLILLVAACSLALSVLLPILAYAMGRRRLALVFTAILAGAAGVAVLLGVLGQALGLVALTAAVQTVSPADRDLIRALGAAEARTCLAFGLMAAVAPVMAALIAFGRAATERVSAAVVSGAVILAFGAGVMLGGTASHQLALFQRGRAVAMADPEFRAAIEHHGSAAARAHLVGGLGVGAPLALIGAALVLAGRARSRAKPVA